MRKITIEAFDLLEIGHNIHLTGTMWTDFHNGDHYVIPVSKEIPEGNVLVVDADTHDNLKILNQAWVLETRRDTGFLGYIKRCIFSRIQKQEIDSVLVWKVFRRDKFICVYCGRDDVPMTFDHYIPLSQGGGTTEENGRTACRRCNQAKADMMPDDWLASEYLKKRKIHNNVNPKPR